MKIISKILFLLLSSTFFTNAQVDTTFVYESKKITLLQKEWGEQQTLIIRDNDDNILQKFDLNKKEIDPYRIAESYTGERNFIVIGGRYEFYILALTSNKLSGPYTCCCRTEPQDAQTGVLGTFKIFANGQYLLVGSFDNGSYCFKLADLYNPEKVPWYAAANQPYPTSCLFLDNRNENIYNGIFATYKNYSNTIDYKFLLHGYRFEQNPNGEIKKEIVSDKFLILNQLDSEGNVSKLKIDLKEGLIAED